MVLVIDEQMVLVIDEQELVAWARVGQAGITGRARVGAPAHSPSRCELFVGEREQMGKVFGRQASDSETHHPLLYNVAERYLMNAPRCTLSDSCGIISFRTDGHRRRRDPDECNRPRR